MDLGELKNLAKIIFKPATVRYLKSHAWKKASVHTEAAIRDFWNTEFITAVPFIIGVNLLAISTALFRMYKNKKKKTLS